MSKHGPAADKENFVWVSSSDKYLPRYELDRSHEGTDYADDWTGKSFYGQLIDRFIDQFCIKQIKHTVPLKDLLNKIEKGILIKVLSRFNGRQKATSKFLKIKNTTLHEKMKRHKIRVVKTIQ